MSKEENVTVTGEVVDCLPGTLFRIKIGDLPHLVVAHLSGRMRKNKIRVLLGDRVEMEMSPYDLTKGRIVKRF